MTQVSPPPADETIAVHNGDFPQLQARCRRQWRIWAAVCAGGTLLGAAVSGSAWGWGLLVASAVLLAIVSIRLSHQLSQYYKGEIVPQLVRHFCDEESTTRTAASTKRYSSGAICFRPGPTATRRKT